MSTKVRAVYDGKALQLKEPLDLPPDTEVEITIDRVNGLSEVRYRFFKAARSLHLEGPPDWSERYEEYHYQDPNTLYCS